MGIALNVDYFATELKTATMDLMKIPVVRKTLFFVLTNDG